MEAMLRARGLSAGWDGGGLDIFSEAAVPTKH